MSLGSENEYHPEPIPIQIALNAGREALDQFESGNVVGQKLRYKALHLCHWLLETYDTPDETGNLSLYTDSEGWDGDQLTLDMQPIVLGGLKDTPLLSGQNTASLTTSHLIIYEQSDAELAGWDTAKDIPTLEDMVKFYKDRPELLSEIRPVTYPTIPRLQLVFRPDYPSTSGVQFLLSEREITAYPFGLLDETKKVTDYVIEGTANPDAMVKAFCTLSLLIAEHSIQAEMCSTTKQQIELLDQRFRGEAELPILHPKSRNI